MQPAATELVAALHPGKVTSGPFDHCQVVDGLKDPQQQLPVHIDPLVAGLLYIMIKIRIASPMLRKCLKISRPKASSATPARSSPPRHRPGARNPHAASFLRS
jgi:hypothetical protein